MSQYLCLYLYTNNLLADLTLIQFILWITNFTTHVHVFVRIVGLQLFCVILIRGNVRLVGSIVQLPYLDKIGGQST